MQVSEVLANPHVHLGRRIAVEGSAQIGEFEDLKKHVWISDAVTNRDEVYNPGSGLLVIYPGIKSRFHVFRSGRTYPYVGFECQGILVETPLCPFSYAIIDLSVARYKQLEQDHWQGMYLSLLPQKLLLLEMLSIRSNDEERVEGLLTMLRNDTDW